MRANLSVCQMLCACALLGVAAAAAAAAPRPSASHPRRPARSIPQFSAMIACLPGDWHGGGVHLLGYGCYCGLGGAGNATDDLDRCCYEHDHCYGRLQASLCSGFGGLDVYFLPYAFIQAGCGTDDFTITCDSPAGTCAHALCECDRVATQCFHDNRHVYNRTRAACPPPETPPGPQGPVEAKRDPYRALRERLKLTRINGIRTGD